MTHEIKGRADLCVRVGVFLLGASVLYPFAKDAWRAGGGVAAGALYALYFGTVGSHLGLLHWLCEVIAHHSGLPGLFYPEASFRHPQPSYGPVRALRTRGQFDEAMAGYEAIVREHPHEVRAYCEMIDLAVADMGNPALGRAIYRYGRSRLTRDEDLAALDEAYRFATGYRTRP